MSASFRLKKMTERAYRLQLGRDKIGSVWTTPGDDDNVEDVGWRAKARVRGVSLYVTGYETAEDAFDAIVRKANRVLLVGEDSPAKAAAKLRELNDRVAKRARELRAQAAAMNREAGRPIANVRVTSKKVLL